MRKRIADWLEKFSIASLAVGLYQEKTIGVAIGLVCVILSFYLTWRDEQ